MCLTLISNERSSTQSRRVKELSLFPTVELYDNLSGELSAYSPRTYDISIWDTMDKTRPVYIQCNNSNLVVQIRLVHMAMVRHEFQIPAVCIYIHRLKLTSVMPKVCRQFKATR